MWKRRSNTNNNKKLSAKVTSSPSTRPKKSCLKTDRSSASSSSQSTSTTKSDISNSLKPIRTDNNYLALPNLSGHSRQSRISSSRRSDGSRSSTGSALSESSIHQSSFGSKRSSSRNVNFKSVNFGEVHVRDYVRIVGDNPSCSSGAPIGIGWAHAETKTFDVDEFETNKEPTKRTGNDLIIPRRQRENLLFHWGADSKDLANAVRASHKAKNQRRQTLRNLRKAQLEEGIESMTKTLRRTFMGKPSTSEEVRKLQHQAQLAAHHALKMEHINGSQKLRKNVVREPPAGTLERMGMQVTVSDLSRNAPKKSHIGNESVDDSADNNDASTIGGSTTASMREIERFHKELEAELFGEEGLPDMVGHTLECLGSDIPEDQKVFSEAPEYPMSLGPLSMASTLPSIRDDENKHVLVELPRPQSEYPQPPQHLDCGLQYHETDFQPMQRPYIHSPKYMHSADYGRFDTRDGEPSPYHPVPVPSNFDEAPTPISRRSYPEATTLRMTDYRHFQKNCPLPPSAFDIQGGTHLSSHSNHSSQWSEGDRYGVSYSQPPAHHYQSDGPQVRHVPLSANLSPSSWMDGGRTHAVRRNFDPVIITEGPDEIIDQYGIQGGSAHHDNSPQQYDEELPVRPMQQPVPVLYN